MLTYGTASHHYINGARRVSGNPCRLTGLTDTVRNRICPVLIRTEATRLHSGAVKWSDTLRNQKQATTNALYLTDRQELLLVMYPTQNQYNTVIYTTLKGSSYYVQRPWESRHQDGIRPIWHGCFQSKNYLTILFFYTFNHWKIHETKKFTSLHRTKAAACPGRKSPIGTWTENRPRISVSGPGIVAKPKKLWLFWQNYFSKSTGVPKFSHPFVINLLTV